MSMKRFFVVLMLCALFAGKYSCAEKVQSTFWGCGFGSSCTVMEESLKKSGLNPIVNDGNIFLKDVELNGIIFKTVALIFSPIDGGFFKVIGSNVFEDRSSADSCYSEALAFVREKYPNVQIIRKPEQAEKMCTYLDDENIFYLGLFSSKKGGKKMYYVNVNFWNKLMNRRIMEMRGDE